MSAKCITVGVVALDQVQLPKGTGVRGWAARLAATSPVLAPGAEPVMLAIAEGAEGLVLADSVSLMGKDWKPGLRVQAEPVAGRAGLILFRLGGKAVAVASVAPWEPGAAHQALAPEVPEALAAYTAETLIDTPDGPRAAGGLVAGDVVTTLANGSRPLRWVGRRRVSLVEMLAYPGLRPVAFAAGSVGNDRALIVSPQQRMLIDDWRAAVYFGEDRVLVSAQALVDDHASRLVLPEAGVDYVVLLCDRHEVLIAEGALSESFHPGEDGLAALDPAARADLSAVVAETELVRRRAAFPIVRNAEARALRLQG
ncbi:MAG: Hint domain-containing protein [Tabrizicola sp.]|jgi:hypothetical protein|nr:Hint domain-containing protein [Tabrizicola sp.]